MLDLCVHGRVAAGVPPLSVVGVSIEQATECVPLRSIGVTPLLDYYEDIRLPRDLQASFRFAGCAALPPSWRSLWDLPSSRLCHSDVPRSQTPVDPRKPWRLAPLVLPSAPLTASASTIDSDIEAHSLHAFALWPITSLCTLRWHRYRDQRNTQFLVPCQGFQYRDFHPIDKAELCSAH